MNRFPCRPDTGINRKAKHRLEDRLVSEECQRVEVSKCIAAVGSSEVRRLEERCAIWHDGSVARPWRTISSGERLLVYRS